MALKRLTARRDANQKATELQPALRVTPRATREHRWNPDWLDILHVHLMEQWAVNTQRVHLQGFSMGGFGTLQWGMRHPNRFATLTPMACHLWPWRNDPQLDEKLAELSATPIWLVCGGKDRSLSAFLEMYERMKDKKLPVRMSVYASRGHGGL